MASPITTYKLSDQGFILGLHRQCEEVVKSCQILMEKRKGDQVSIFHLNGAAHKKLFTMNEDKY